MHEDQGAWYYHTPARALHLHCSLVRPRRWGLGLHSHVQLHGTPLYLKHRKSKDIDMLLHAALACKLQLWLTVLSLTGTTPCDCGARRMLFTFENTPYAHQFMYCLSPYWDQLYFSLITAWKLFRVDRNPRHKIWNFELNWSQYRLRHKVWTCASTVFQQWTASVLPCNHRDACIMRTKYNPSIIL